ncbi:4-(cytidine 5'-diphospho)-2-C-methyl-D-erythritol kinase [Aliiroseovarius sp. F20344]|uniref:4-(cytidine 5'-diphospho)-2-C-methyl-D-erythritol kinase n=1 Tax=Aliiroseovarius sp. F20344 TaxID=2926414 RepID=UPI001FF5334D|nr:4-(cytidine 5'-diphospho)-2-C-methyl-D-erythritol kinase [Aliiroseovarius sp. F20344]MCK0140841.1 4-(cytidine 5'-diphospho)-2-C-methyl-D-erythritol kinase [Aliiroseovarius sp. F20344]
MSIAKFFAPAKVNLTLHVTGQRNDGYHLLDSLVVFADVGDRITVIPAEKNRLEVIGPRAEGVPTDGRNLVARAADLFSLPVHIILSKHLPAAAGIGGGSSDAAATILALSDIVGDTRLPEGVADLGADVRVCLLRQAARMRGIGDDVMPCPGLPRLFAVLANPGVDVPTPEVFKALEDKQNSPMPKKIPQGMKTAAFIDWLATQRNDLETPAIAHAPVIQEVLTALSALDGARLTRMSGSGATCFALFETEAEAHASAAALTQAQPGWWVEAASLS